MRYLRIEVINIKSEKNKKIPNEYLPSHDNPINERSITTNIQT